MLVLGLDPSQKTGFAWYDTNRSLSAIRAGVIKAEGDCYEEMAGDLARKLGGMLRAERPDFIAIEAPLRQKAPVKRKAKLLGDDAPEQGAPDFGGLNAIISSNQITGALVGVASFKGIPWAMVSSGTWRKSFLGFGRQTGWARKDWKKATRERCAVLKIPVTNDDMADAVGVAFTAPGLPDFKFLQHRTEQAA